MKKRIILIFLSIVIIFFFATFFIFLLQKPKPRYLTNISKLYAQFTPYMKTWVDSHLERINCKPSEFYITSKENSKEVCFICNNIDACFGYGLVEREEPGKKMNPKGTPYLKNIKNFTTEIADFYKDGLATKFNCRFLNTNSLKCDYGLIFQLAEDKRDVNIILKDKDIFPEICEIICKELANSKPVYYKGGYVCENSLVIVGLNGDLLMYVSGK
jgi:hypothetical protein